MPGGAHMPALHHRIHDHLVAKGFTDSIAWAIATDAIAKGCRTGDVNFPGKQQMNPISRAKYCEAYAQWRANHKGSGRGKNPTGRG